MNLGGSFHWTTGRVCILAVLVSGLCALLVIVSSKIAAYRVEKRIAAVPVGTLREACRSLIAKREALLVAESDVDAYMKYRFDHDVVLTRKSRLYETECPQAIKLLHPRYVVVYTDHIFVYLSGLPRRSIYVFGEGFEGERAGSQIIRELGEGVWLQGEGKHVATKHRMESSPSEGGSGVTQEK